jgi:hypothetical protein
VFADGPFVLTLEGQYIVKNLVLVSGALVVGAAARGGRRLRRATRRMRSVTHARAALSGPATGPYSLTTARTTVLS